jgi:predicted HTH domain antitoxin
MGRPWGIGPNTNIYGLSSRRGLCLVVRFSWVVLSHPICYPQTMQITVQLPDDLIQHPNPGREALEALAIEGYRVGTLSHYQASQLLGLSRFEFDGFLKGRHIYDHAYDLEDLEEDRETLRQLQAEGLLRR